MEPVSAFALACGVLQVIEQAIRVTTTCKTIYDRGSLAENDDIEEMAHSVRVANDSLVKNMSTTILAPSEQRLKKLASEASQTANELTKVLNKIKYAQSQSSGRARVFKQCLCTMVKKSTIEYLRIKLENHEVALTSGLIKALYVKCGEASICNAASFARLDQGQQDLIRTIIESNLIATQHHNQKLKQVETRIMTSHAASEGRLSSKLTTMQTDYAVQDARKQVLQSLFFPEISQRQHMIETRIDDYGKTFEWIFQPLKTSSHSFAAWLDQGTGIYWISGKPGSGKSSLMAFLHNSLQPSGPQHTRLQAWAGPRKCLLLSYFAYNPSANKLLKTPEGLWRTLMYQLCQADQNATDLLRASVGSLQVQHSNYVWSVPELRRLSMMLLDYVKIEYNMMLLIDGIDEFEDSQESLIQTMQNIVDCNPGIKICCASRPENISNILLTSYPTLRMEHHTKDDMRDVCTRFLSTTSAACLVPEIITKSDGIFLWTHIVAEELRRASIFNGALIEDLRMKLSDFPQGMSPLFGHMLSRISSSSRRTGKPYLNLIYHAQNLDISHLNLVMALGSDTFFQRATSNTITETFLHEVAEACRTAYLQISACCGGLVQTKVFARLETNLPDPDEAFGAIFDASWVGWDFIHRTARDFLCDEEIGMKLLQKGPLTMSKAYEKLWPAVIGSHFLLHTKLAQKPSLSTAPIIGDHAMLEADLGSLVRIDHARMIFDLQEITIFLAKSDLEEQRLQLLLDTCFQISQRESRCNFTDPNLTGMKALWYSSYWLPEERSLGYCYLLALITNKGLLQNYVHHRLDGLYDKDLRLESTLLFLNLMNHHCVMQSDMSMTNQSDSVEDSHMQLSFIKRLLHNIQDPMRDVLLRFYSCPPGCLHTRLYLHARTSLWAYFLVGCMNIISTSKSNSQFYLLNSLRLMLDHGADPNAYISVSYIWDWSVHNGVRFRHIVPEVEECLSVSANNYGEIRMLWKASSIISMCLKAWPGCFDTGLPAFEFEMPKITKFSPMGTSKNIQLSEAQLRKLSVLCQKIISPGRSNIQEFKIGNSRVDVDVFLALLINNEKEFSDHEISVATINRIWKDRAMADNADGEVQGEPIVEMIQRDELENGSTERSSLEFVNAPLEDVYRYEEVQILLSELDNFLRQFTVQELIDLLKTPYLRIQPTQ